MEDLLKLITDNQRYIAVLLVFMLLDIITGVIKAILSKELKSSKFREGLLKKVLEVIIVILGFALDWASSLEYIGKGCVIALVLMEAWSILENIENYVPIPEVLKKFLESVKTTDNN